MTGEEVVLERLREAFGSLEERAPGLDCADPARIWAAARGELRGEETRGLLDHALACPTCATAWRLAREVAAEVEGAARVRTRRPLWIAAAAAAIVVALVPVGLRLWRGPETPAYRTETRAEIRSLVPEGQSLPRDAFLLRWTPGQEGAWFSIRVVSADLSVVAEATGTDGAAYLVPAEKLRDLPSGAVLYWQVEARLEDGSRLLSGTFSARLE